MSGGETIDLQAPPEVYRIARRLQAAGYEAWAVGGGVRDSLAGGHPVDWDFATSARPSQVQALFRRTIPVGVDHGTVGVLGKDGIMYEVTTFRRDVETFGRKARVAFSDTLEEDLERRDFTINAVAWNPTSGEIRDPHQGAAHLREGVLRTVGEPSARFAEDRLRVLRALRFAGRFSLRIHPATWEAMREVAGGLGGLSAERVREELYKTLALARPSESLRLYQQSGVLAHLYPELEASVTVEDDAGGGSVWEHLLRTTDALGRRDPTLRLVALLHDVGKPPVAGHAGRGAALARAIVQRLKGSNADTDRVVHLVAQHAGLPGRDASDADVRRWLRVVGTGHYRDLFRLRFADCRARGGEGRELLEGWRRVRRILAARPPLDVGDLAIGGAELRHLGIPPGPRFGEILRELLERVTDDPALNTKERLSEMAGEMNG